MDKIAFIIRGINAQGKVVYEWENNSPETAMSFERLVVQLPMLLHRIKTRNPEVIRLTVDIALSAEESNVPKH